LIDQVMAEMSAEGDVMTVVQACRWAGAVFQDSCHCFHAKPLASVNAVLKVTPWWVTISPTVTKESRSR
jgi:hypothetical protein